MKIAAIWHRMPRLLRVGLVIVLSPVALLVFCFGFLLAFLIYDGSIHPQSREVNKVENARYSVVVRYDPEPYGPKEWVDVYYVDKESLFRFKEKIVHASGMEYASAEFLDESTVRIVLYGSPRVPRLGTLLVAYDTVEVDLRDPGLKVVGTE